MSAVLQSAPASRAIVLRTRGRRHGPVTRLVSPSVIGELIKPFVFLDLFDISATGAPNFGWHPHSGIATLTVLHEGAIEYQETTGVKGVLSAGGVEWMRAGGGVWHTGAALQSAKEIPIMDCAAAASPENAPCQSHYLECGRSSGQQISLCGSFWAPMAGPRAQSMLLRASTTWMFSLRPVNDGPTNRRRATMLPGSRSPKDLSARQNPLPRANWWCSRNRTPPSPFRR